VAKDPGEKPAKKAKGKRLVEIGLKAKKT